jgi:hypothetical protein
VRGKTPNSRFEYVFDQQINLWLELDQIGGRHLTDFAGDLEQPVLVNLALDAGRQVERLPKPRAQRSTVSVQ